MKLKLFCFIFGFFSFVSLNANQYSFVVEQGCFEQNDEVYIQFLEFLQKVFEYQTSEKILEIHNWLGLHNLLACVVSDGFIVLKKEHRESIKMFKEHQDCNLAFNKKKNSTFEQLQGFIKQYVPDVLWEFSGQVEVAKRFQPPASA